jgi:hypothetical protein
MAITGHPQQQHDTSHGSMTETQWLINGPESASYELQDHKYGSGDQGSTVLCSMVCSQQGRHVHVDYCRHNNVGECGGEEYQHITQRISPHPNQPKDWISHRLYWERSGMSISHFSGGCLLKMRNIPYIKRLQRYACDWSSANHSAIIYVPL